MSTDYWLIQKIKKGNTEACDELVSKYYKDILNYFTYRCVNKETAKDLTQDTFLKFFEHIYMSINFKIRPKIICIQLQEIF